MRPEAQFHKGSGFRKARGHEPIIGLIAKHGGARLSIPVAGGFTLIVARVQQGFLDFAHTFRIHFQPGQSLAMRKMPPTLRS